MRHLIRRTLGTLAILTLATVGTACSAPQEDAENDASELRALEKGDVDISLLEHVAAEGTPPEAFAGIKTWSVHYVEQCDARYPAKHDPDEPFVACERPDPQDPFKGVLMVAKDAHGLPLFFSVLALTDDGIAHFYFSVKTDERGQYQEIPLLAKEGDPEAAKVAKQTEDWLNAEKVRLGNLLRSRLDSSTSGQGLRTQGFTEWKNGVKCIADVAVFALTLSNPIAFFVAQAAVDGVSAVVDAVAGGDIATDASGAIGNATIGGVSKGVGKLATKFLSKEAVALAKSAGGVVLAVGMVGVVGYQLYQAIKKDGLAKGLLEAGKMGLAAVIPTSCQEVYKSLTKAPHNDVAKPEMP